MILLLDRLWINPVADLTSGRSFSCNAVTHPPRNRNIRADFYAAGNLRRVSQPGAQITATAAVNFGSDDDQQWLTDHEAALICWRDPRGLKAYGWYTIDATPRLLPDSWQMALSFTEVTYNEAT